MTGSDEASRWWDWFSREGGVAPGCGVRPPVGRIGAWYRDHPEAFAVDAVLGWLVRHPDCAPAIRLAGLPVAEEGLPEAVRTGGGWALRASHEAQYPVLETPGQLWIAAGPGALASAWHELAAGRQLLRWAASPDELQAQERIFRRLRDHPPWPAVTAWARAPGSSPGRAGSGAG